MLLLQPYPVRLKKPLQGPPKIDGAGGAGTASFGRENRFPGGLPGRANATIRSPAATGINSPDPGSARRHRSLKALICRDYLS
jgi:hypothetical protein